MQTRRMFCVHACQAASLAAVGSIFQGCASPTAASSSVASLPTAGATIVNGAVVLTIDSVSPLSAVGSAALVQTALGTFLVAHTTQNAFTALTAICTHEACTITGFSNQSYVCPCHGSQFNTSGAVLNGPATVALRQFPAQFANDMLTITP